MLRWVRKGLLPAGNGSHDAVGLQEGALRLGLRCRGRRRGYLSVFTLRANLMVSGSTKVTFSLASKHALIHALILVCLPLSLSFSS